MLGRWIVCLGPWMVRIGELVGGGVAQVTLRCVVGRLDRDGEDDDDDETRPMLVIESI